MSNAVATFDTENDFLDAELTDTQAVIDASGEVWLAFAGEDEWYCVRPLGEEEPKGPQGDEARPLGPVPIGWVEFPVTAVDVHKAASVEASTNTDNDEYIITGNRVYLKPGA